MLVGNSLLKPKGFGVDGDGGIGDGRNFFGATEDVDDVDRFRDVFKAGIGFLAEDFGFVRIYGDDFVADALEVGSNFVGGTSGIGGESDDGDGFGVAEEVADGVGGIGSVSGEMKDHEDSMMVARKE